MDFVNLILTAYTDYIKTVCYVLFKSTKINKQLCCRQFITCKLVMNHCWLLTDITVSDNVYNFKSAHCKLLAFIQK